MKAKMIHYSAISCLLILATACSTEIERRRTTPSYMDPTTIAEVEPGVFFEVPKTGANTKAIDVEKNTSIDKIICFEDTKNGDYDYNDLVIYVRVVKKGKGSSIALQIKPMALGAKLPSGLGVQGLAQDGKTELYNELIIPDVRSTLFNGDMGFLNAEAGVALKDYPLNTDYEIDVKDITNKNKDICKINFYILVNNQKMFAGTEGAPMDIEGRPYGIILLNKDFKYPQERVNINQVYSGCDAWFDGRNPDFKFDNPQGAYIDAPFENTKFK
jgi:hypothetical protein